MQAIENGRTISLQVDTLFAKPRMTTADASLPTAAAIHEFGQGYWIIGPAAWKSAMESFVRGQRALGRRVEYRAIEELLAAYAEAPDAADALRAALADAATEGVAYALLVGDGSVMPVRYASDVSVSVAPSLDLLQPCDLFFADFDGRWDADGDGVFGEPVEDSADIAAEVALGRLPVATALDAAAWCAKWERYVFARGDLSYLGRALGLASDQMRDDAAGAGQAAVVARAWPRSIAHDSVTLLEYPYGGAADPLAPWAYDVIDVWNRGWGIVQIFAHGRWDGFALKTSAYNAWPKSYLLTDPEASGAHDWLGRLAAPAGIVYSVACNQAAFDAQAALAGTPGLPCVAACLLADPDGGAVTFVGYARWGWVYTSYRVAGAFWEAVFDSGYTAGAALQMAKLRYPYLLDVAYGHNLYGDPSLRIWKGVPGAISAELPAFVPAADARFVVNASAAGAPVEALVSVLSGDGELLALRTTDSAGHCEVDLGVTAPQALVVTVSAFGLAPLQDTIQVSIVSGIEDDEVRPLAFALDNYPNPFNAETTIRIAVATPADALLALFDALGRRVRGWRLGTIADAANLTWNGCDESGRPLPSGVYFARLEGSFAPVTRKLLLLK
jgi:hypothetical protein